MTGADVKIDCTSTEWLPTHGGFIFALLILVAIGFILLPSPNSFPQSCDCFPRLSPFVCLYDFLQRIVEVAFTLHARHPASKTDRQFGISFRPKTTTSYQSLSIRLSATAALLFLLTLRHALWTQLIAILYLTHWITRCITPIHQSSDTAEQDREVHRITNMLFSFLCHWLFARPRSPGLSIIYHGLAFGAISSIMSAFAAIFAEPSPREKQDEGPMAFIGQILFLIFTAWAWLLLCWPGPLLYQHPLETATQWEQLAECFFPALVFHFGSLCFFFSQQELENAHHGFKVAVGLMWSAVGMFFYIWVYPVYGVMGLPVAERLTLYGLTGGGREGL